MLTPALAARAADAMLRVLGGDSVTLRIPSGATLAESDLPSGIGLAVPPSDDITLSPAVVRPLAIEHGRRRFEVLFAASALSPHLERSGLALDDFLAAAFGLLLESDAINFAGSPGTLLRLTGVTVERFAGQAYLVRLTTEE